MIFQKLHKSGDNFVVTIPKDEIERLGLQEGQMLAIELLPTEGRSISSEELRKAFEESWKRNEAGYRYLAGR